MARFSNSVSVQAYVAAVWVDASMSMAIDGDSPLQWPNANSALARWPNNINNNKWAVHARADLGLCDSRRQCRNCRRRSRGEKCVYVCATVTLDARVRKNITVITASQRDDSDTAGQCQASQPTVWYVLRWPRTQATWKLLLQRTTTLFFLLLQSFFFFLLLCFVN